MAVSGGQSDKTVADRYLAMLAGKVDYIFANAGTDFPPIIESLARAGGDESAAPKAMAIPHENLAVAMAHGHTMVSGRTQAVMVHVSVGTANAICGIFNASRERIPMLVAAGRTPLLESGAAGARDRYIHWAQEMYDQAGMVRELVRWDYELRRPEQLDTVIGRAFAMAEGAPGGPVYLTLPREVLAQSLPDTLASKPAALPRMQIAKPGPEPAAIEAAAAILAAAERPLIVTASVGRNPAAVAELGKLADAFALPVAMLSPRYMCLPSAHPMHMGYDPGALLKEADAILVLDCDVPWMPSVQSPPENCRIVHLGEDPQFAAYPVRGFAGEIAIPADPVTALPALAAAMAALECPHVQVRRGRLEAAKAALSENYAGAVKTYSSAQPIHPIWISHCIDQIRGEDSIVVNELCLSPGHMNFTTPGTYFAPSPAGGLGWGLGAALGAKLAAPDRLVVAAIGDGSYMFGNPTPAHFVSAAHDLPVLFVVNNNSGWGAVKAATRSMYPDGLALQRNRVPLAALDPSPAFEKVIEASGGYGERVENPAELPAALERAAHVVRVEKRQALVNVITQDR